jgi:dihydropteroate synthase
MCCLNVLMVVMQKENPELVELLVANNPMSEGIDNKEHRIEVLRRLPNLKKIDGEVVSGSERKRALGEE